MTSHSVAPPRPRFRNVPPAEGNDAQRATDLAKLAGLNLLPWQVDALAAMLGYKADGRWAAPTSALICPRQNGKGGVLEAFELFLLFLCPDVELIVHTAHRFDTAQDHFRRIRGLIENTPELMARVKSIRVANGSEGIELKDGSRLLFKARSKGGIRGMSPHVVVLDEAFYLWDEALSAILPAQSAREDPLTVFASSSPIPGPESDVLRRLCKQGRAGVPWMAYIEYSAPPGSDLDDEAVWAEVNPSSSVLIDLATLRGNRAVMTDEAFGAEHLGIWLEDEGAGALVDPRAWSDGRCSPVGSFLSDPVCFGLELTGDRSWATFVAAGHTADGRVGGEVVAHHPGTDWVLRRAQELNASGPTWFVIDPRSQAGSFIAEFRAAGLPVLECGFTDLARATGSMFDAIANREIAHLGDPLMDAAVAGATKRAYGDVWLWDRRVGTTITPLVAFTLARFGLVEAVPAEFEVVAFYA